MKYIIPIVLIVAGFCLVAISVTVKSLSNAGMVTVCFGGIAAIVGGIILSTTKK